MTHPTVRFRSQELTVELTRYARPKNPAIQLWSSTDGPYCRASVNTDELLPPGMIAIKNWSENEGILDALIDARIVGKPVYSYPEGFVEIMICPLLIQEEP